PVAGGSPARCWCTRWPGPRPPPASPWKRCARPPRAPSPAWERWGWGCRPAQCRQRVGPGSSWAPTRSSWGWASTASPACGARGGGDARVDEMLSTLVGDRRRGGGDRVALLVNTLGATPSLELSIAAGAALGQLAASGLIVERAWTGSFLTALDMAGVSLSL